MESAEANARSRIRIITNVFLNIEVKLNR